MMSEFCLKHGAPHAPGDCAECDRAGGDRTMKTAKEWAESVVTVPGDRSGEWWVHLEDDRAHVQFVPPWGEGHGQEIANDARGIIERLVERVQADARASLEEEIVRLRAENARLNEEHAEYREFIAGANDMLAEEHEQARRLGE